jgi:syndetin
MGFSDHTIHNISLIPDSYTNKKRESQVDGGGGSDESTKLSDQEILDSTEAIYFAENINMEEYQVKRLTEDEHPLDIEEIENSMGILKQQHKVISKKVLQLILEKKSDCNREFQGINETEAVLQETVWSVQKARSYLNFAKKHLTTSSLEILAAYRKRQTLQDLLEVLKFLQELKSTNETIENLIKTGSYSEAITLLLQNKNRSEKYSEYKCTELFKQRLQDTLDSTEITLDNALNSITTKFDAKLYSELINSYKLLGKAHLAMDQLHMNFISAIHTSAFNVLKENLDQMDQKLLFEQMCENLNLEQLTNCITQLCKAFWRILVSYYQVKMWHQNYKLYSKDNNESDNAFNDDYFHEKLKKGESRLWSDVQAKMTIFITSTKLSHLKYENFVQVLSVVQRMKKVGYEFCEDNSQKMLEAMKSKSIEFFQRYHAACLDEINLFLDHEIWIQVHALQSVLQLQEFKSTKRAIRRHLNEKKSDGNESAAVLSVNNSPTKHRGVIVDDCSVNSEQDGSSIYTSSGYSWFIRFLEKNSPFDVPYDQKMILEDMLAGLADETSCYYSEDSSDNDNENVSVQISEADKSNGTTGMTVNNTSLNILRIMGRYLGIMKLLYSISPHIVYSITELIDFYIYSVYEIFAKDLSVPGEKLHSAELSSNLKRISETIIPKVHKFPPSIQMIEHDLRDPEQFYALAKRINAVESVISIMNQFVFLRGYLDHLIMSTNEMNPDELSNERQSLSMYYEEMKKCVEDLRKPIYMAVTSKAIDIPTVITTISKVKWDVEHVIVEHNAYVSNLNRVS